MAATHKGSKALICIRDPYDASVSAFNLIYTVTQNKSLTDETFEKNKDAWYEFVDKGTEGWVNWSNYWRDVGENGKLPTHFFLFEDLKEKPQEVLEGILKFLVDGRDIKGTYLE